MNVLHQSTTEKYCPPLEPCRTCIIYYTCSYANPQQLSCSLTNKILGPINSLIDQGHGANIHSLLHESDSMAAVWSAGTTALSESLEMMVGLWGGSPICVGLLAHLWVPKVRGLRSRRVSSSLLMHIVLKRCRTIPIVGWIFSMLTGFITLGPRSTVSLIQDLGDYQVGFDAAGTPLIDYLS